MILRALLDATPPPPTDADADSLLFAFEVMLSTRQQLLDQWREPVVVTDTHRELVEQLGQREAAWRDALAKAHADVSQHRVNAGKLRGYAPARAGGL